MQNDGYEYPDSGLFNTSVMSLCNHGFTPDLSVNIDLDDPDVVDHLLPEVHISNASSQEAVSQRPNNSTASPEPAANAKVSIDRFNKDNSVYGKGNKKSGEQLKVPLNNGNNERRQNYTKTNKNCKNVSCAEKTRKIGDQECAMNDQTGLVKSQTHVVNDQINVANGQTNVFNGHTEVVNSQTGVAKWSDRGSA